MFRLGRARRRQPTERQQMGVAYTARTLLRALVAVVAVAGRALTIEHSSAELARGRLRADPAGACPVGAIPGIDARPLAGHLALTAHTNLSRGRALCPCSAMTVVIGAAIRGVGRAGLRGTIHRAIGVAGLSGRIAGDAARGTNRQLTVRCRNRTGVVSDTYFACGCRIDEATSAGAVGALGCVRARRSILRGASTGGAKEVL
jgi:hypothetical protein